MCTARGQHPAIGAERQAYLSAEVEHPKLVPMCHIPPGQPHTQPLYDCAAVPNVAEEGIVTIPEADIADHFVSFQSNCEGYGVGGLEGYIYATPPPGVPTVQLYRCYTGHDHYVSTRSDCEGLGHAAKFSFGYALATAPLRRFINYGTATHWMTTANDVTGYRFQETLGSLLTTPQPDTDTQALYDCQVPNTNDYFVSGDVNCEGYGDQARLWLEGYSYTTPPPDVETVPLYRCFTGYGHFVSTDPGCEGQSTEFLLGYALAQQ